MKGGLEYETTPEDKQRRKIIPTRDYRLDTGWANRIECGLDYCVLKCRQSFNIFVRHIRNKRVIFKKLI